ncbi:response regulator [Caulobacter endophyticus]|uniref:Response regulator n=1 Tax=Caulobacter endophyticus TaxID=2172652 RepID=A0A2T9K6B0_9CAUL|nr:response regulator [Caulobacter endophyticus]PVM91489.1 response regulator [Caulobacter endophyticus]
MLVTPPQIYVADDDALTRELVEIQLGRGGYGARSFETVEELLSAVAAAPPSLILLDVRMPGLSGLDALRSLKSAQGAEDIPVLMLTGEGRLDRIVQALQLGAAGYVMKPFTGKALVDKIGEVLAAGG